MSFDVCELLTLGGFQENEANTARRTLPDDRPPSAPSPTVGGSGGPTAGGQPTVVEEEPEKNLPHPPPEEPQAGEVATAERVLLSLRHEHRDLHLGVREARGLAQAAAEWLRRGVSAPDLRRALAAGLPACGVRSAVGFLRHRLVEKLPAPVEQAAPPVGVPGALIACEGPGDEHVFRPLGDETRCGPCRTATAAAAAGSSAAQPRTRPATPWRELVAQEANRV